MHLTVNKIYNKLYIYYQNLTKDMKSLIKYGLFSIFLIVFTLFHFSCTGKEKGNRIIDPIFKTDYGLVRGVVNGTSSVVAFKGIPYAAAPVGDLRWKAPQAPKSWDGVRDATTFCSSCMQNRAHSRLPWTEEFMVQDSISEDCLYINIWTPAKTSSDKLGVLIYFHGGGFNEGSGSVAVYDGEALAKKGIVVINANYRLGVLGFLAHPELTAESPDHASGNYGVLDMVSVLKWVKANIPAFGGDPEKVCISGQSAGAMAVNALVASPLAKGLFQRAITESGSSLRGIGSGNMTTLKEAETRGVNFAKLKGALNLSELRARPATEILKQDPKVVVPVGMGFGLIIDGYLLTDSPVNVLKIGKQNDTPFMTGLNSGETRYSGEKSPGFFSLYPLTGQDTAAALKTAGQEQGRIGAFLYLNERDKSAKTNGYCYYFDKAIPWPEHPEFGAFHTGEVPYIFNTFNKLNRHWTAADSLVAERMASYWVNFVRTGDPNGSGLPQWTPFKAESKNIMQLNEKMGMIPLTPTEEKYKFLVDVILKPVSPDMSMRR